MALGGFTILFRILTGNSLGVSGSWRKVAFWREESRNEKAGEDLAGDQQGASNALMAATLAEFGENTLPDQVGEASDATSATQQQLIPWTAHLVFLLSMFIGGALWALYTGDLHFHFGMSEFHKLFSNNNNWTLGLAMLTGGIMVGIGTQMAGGCSSGHGLSGCASFSWVSMLATAIFFMTAVAVSIAIKVFVL